MQDTEMFLSLAEIAGVFVGFGALISVRSGGPSDAHEVTCIRWVPAWSGARRARRSAWSGCHWSSGWRRST